jgi:hypothetical protein
VASAHLAFPNAPVVAELYGEPGSVDANDDEAFVAALGRSLATGLPAGYGIAVEGHRRNGLSRAEREARLREMADEGLIQLRELDSGMVQGDGGTLTRSKGMGVTHGDDVADEVRALLHKGRGLGFSFTFNGEHAWRSNVGDFLDGSVDPSQLPEGRIPASRDEALVQAALGAMTQLQTFLSHDSHARWPEADSKPGARIREGSLHLWYGPEEAPTLELPSVEFD